VIIHLVFNWPTAIPADYFFGFPQVTVVFADFDFNFRATLWVGTGYLFGTVAHYLNFPPSINLFFCAKSYIKKS